MKLLNKECRNEKKFLLKKNTKIEKKDTRV